MGQGLLGNCWFMSACSTLCEDRKAWDRVVPNWRDQVRNKMFWSWWNVFIIWNIEGIYEFLCNTKSLLDSIEQEMNNTHSEEIPLSHCSFWEHGSDWLFHSVPDSILLTLWQADLAGMPVTLCSKSWYLMNTVLILHRTQMHKVDATLPSSELLNKGEAATEHLCMLSSDSLPWKPHFLLCLLFI